MNLKYNLLALVLAAPAISAQSVDNASAMMGNDNYRGSADQLRYILPYLHQGPEREAAELMWAETAAHLPGQDAAELFSQFMEKYPASIYRSKAMLGLAGALYDNQDFAAALPVYQSIEKSSLNPSDAEEANLREAFCLIKFGRNDEAKALLNSLTSTEVANDARFYLAYIDYVEGRTAEAMAGFAKVRNTGEDPSSATPYYIAQINYQLGNYAEALAEGQKLLAAGCPAEYLPETQRIVGESLYKTGNRVAAIPYLENYLRDVETPLPSALFILGENAYNKGDYAEAIRLLNPVTESNDAMGQGAYLLIGQSYMQQGKYDSALLALDRAVRMNASAQQTELASYNYAVASSRGGRLPFASSITLFEEFVKNYPNSTLAPSVNDYIINGYISENNYGAALAAINRITKPTDKVLAAKQQVAYLHGARQLQAGRTDDAITLLKEARSLGRYSGETASEAALWLGEAHYKKGNYKEAVDYYTTFLRETPSSNPNYPLALYDMAYGQFALKNFAKAAEYYNKFLNAKLSATEGMAELRPDALNRLADSYYYQSDLATAATNYRKSIDTAPNQADYPMFQLAVIKGLQRDHAGKIADLDAMMARFPSSALVPSALLESGESYTELGRADKAADTYASLVKRYPSTAQGRQGALLLAIGRLNAGETDKAIEAYKYVISKYPTSEEARTAADDLKHIYADRGDIGAYTRFLASVPDAPKLQQGEIAALQLEAAEKAYEAGRDTDAIRQARELVEGYPDAPQAVEALAILGELQEKQGHPAEALEAYRQLASKSSNEIDVNRARMGIMRISRDLGSDEAVLEVTEQLLASSSLGKDDRREVQLAKALSLANTGNRADADKILAELAATPETVAGAKAAYYLAQSQFDRGNLSASLKTVNALIDSNTPQEYWLARGFILLSDIKRRNGDTFEADEYLRSLRDNYPGSEPDIFSMIQSRL